MRVSWTEARVLHVEQRAKGVQVEAEVKGKQQTLRARAVIFAIPDNSCRGFARNSRKNFANSCHERSIEIVNAAVALAKPPNVPYAGYAFTPDVVSGAESRWSTCALPTGARRQGRRAYFCGTRKSSRLDADDESVKQQASEIVERTFPECRGKLLFVHLVRWNIGIASFRPEIAEMTALRKRLSAWNSPSTCAEIISTGSPAKAPADGRGSCRPDRDEMREQ